MNCSWDEVSTTRTPIYCPIAYYFLKRGHILFCFISNFISNNIFGLCKLKTTNNSIHTFLKKISKCIKLDSIDMDCICLGNPMKTLFRSYSYKIDFLKMHKIWFIDLISFSCCTSDPNPEIWFKKYLQFLKLFKCFQNNIKSDSF